MKAKKSNRAFCKPRKKLEIVVNIWDDYWDDGHVPDGEQQRTHAAIEDDDPLNPERIALNRRRLVYLYEHLKNLPAVADVNVSYTPTTVYTHVFAPGRDDEKRETKEYPDPCIWLVPLPHVLRVQVVKQLQALKLQFEGLPFTIISES